MTTTLHRHRSAREFLDAVGPALERQEDRNNLPLAVALGRESREIAGEPVTPALFAHLGDSAEPDAVLVMTPPWPLLIAAAGPESAAASVHALESVDLTVSGVLARHDVADRFASAWCEAAGVGVARTVEETLHRLDTPEPIPIRSGSLVRAGLAHLPVAVQWAERLAAESGSAIAGPDPASRFADLIGDGDLWIWEDGEPLGIAQVARRTRHCACISGVFTPPDHRGRGVATSLVASLSHHLLNTARSCVLYTDRGNDLSSRIYRRIGYRPLEAVSHIEFDQARSIQNRFGP